MRPNQKGIILFLLLITYCSANAQLITYNCKQYFLNGPNVCWNNYGWDFGDNALGWGGGNGYDPAWWENTFTQIQNYKGNSVRIWVHCKGQHNPLFSSGTCTGLNNNFFNNLDDCLNRAKNHNLLVILCLWDFHLTDVGRQDVVKDINKTNAYINNALIPMVQRYANQCNLLAWEIFNEPEWVMSGVPGAGNFGGAPITISEMQRFVGLCAAAVHNNSDKLVTVGSASLKWNSDVAPASANYWKNSALQSATGGNSQAFLDFYQIHYYDWMLNTGNNFAPYNRPVSYWGLDKPVLIGETGNTGHYNYQQQFDLGYSNGYAGTMVWAYASGGAAGWSEFNNQMKNFRDAHPAIVDFSCSSGSCCTNPNLGPDITLCGGVTNVTLNSNSGSGINKTYKWFRNGSLLSGATGSSYGPTSQAGAYVVEVDSMSGQCVRKDTIIISSALSSPQLGPDRNLCNPSSLDLDAGNYPVAVSYQWMKNGSALTGETSRYLNSIRTAGTYRVEVSSSGCSTVFDEVVIASAVPVPVDGCRTGTGSVTLSITDPGLNGTNYNWYANASGGSPLSGGIATTTFTTPSISATTTYYVQDMSVVSGSVGPTIQLGGNYGRNPTSDARYNLWFNTGAQVVTIDYVTVWAWFNATNTNYYINLRLLNNSNIVQQTNSVAVMSTTGTGWQQKRIPVGFNVPAGVTGWKLDAAGTTMAPVCDLNYAPSGAGYPYNSSPAGVIAITGQGDISWEPNGYSFFYNWEFSTGTSCARLPVIANVGSCSPMPVEWISFSGKMSKDIIELFWTTGYELNNNFFEIERSENGMDFYRIGWVDAMGTSSMENSYYYIDNAPEVSEIYYRIKQLDKNYDFSYSSIIKISKEKIQDLVLYPVPASTGEIIQIRFLSNDVSFYTLKIKDLNGIVKYLHQAKSVKGDNLFQIAPFTFKGGIYIVEVMNEEIVFIEKFIIKE